MILTYAPGFRLSVFSFPSHENDVVAPRNPIDPPFPSNVLHLSSSIRSLSAKIELYVAWNETARRDWSSNSLKLSSDVLDVGFSLRVEVSELMMSKGG